MGRRVIDILDVFQGRLTMSKLHPVQIAFDIGGTFTDFVLQDSRSARMHFRKVPSTPNDPARAVVSGLADLLKELAVSPDTIGAVLHATTVATNAIIERKGARTALITTRGFKDIIMMGRQKRHDTFDLYLEKPVPLVNRRDVFEVDERIAFDGEIVTPLDAASVASTVDAVVAGGYDSVAVAFIHAYVDGRHERAVADAVTRRLPNVSLSLSSVVSPKIREFERFSTTVANAYVKPVVDHYLSALEGALRRHGIRGELFIMQSNAGLVLPQLARDMPIRIVESGPAAGVMMCVVVGREEHCPNILTFDMGGTTAKLGAVDCGEPAVMPTFEVATVNCRPGSGLPLNISAVELLEIGAGGGSVARIDLGLVTVGPDSAGADPGPICYGHGGREPTVTDANLVLGYIDPDYFNGGAIKLDWKAAEDGIRRAIGEPLGLSVGEAAWGVHSVANANMERAMRMVSIERGRDPREYVLVAFGGAGPIHAARLARAIGIPRVIIPHGAGVGSAVGLIAADSRIDASLTRVTRIGRDSSRTISEIYDDLSKRVRADLERLGREDEPSWSRYAYMRYVGQGFERKVDLPDGPIDQSYAAKVLDAFTQSYRRNYGFTDPDSAVEVIDWCLLATVPSSHQALHRSAVAGASSVDRVVTARPAYFPEAGGFVSCRIVDRDRLRPGDRVQGPAVIEEREATTVVPPGDVVTVSDAGNLVIEIAREM
jgi:N-methylhydantoinase A